MEDDINIIMCDLPCSIGGYTYKSIDGYYTIILNSRLSHERNMQTYQHELDHINREELGAKSDVDLLEFRAHERS